MAKIGSACGGESRDDAHLGDGAGCGDRGAAEAGQVVAISAGDALDQAEPAHATDLPGESSRAQAGDKGSQVYSAQSADVELRMLQSAEQCLLASLEEVQPFDRRCQSKFLSCPGCVKRRRMSNPFRYFNSSPEVIRLVVMMYVRYPLSLRNVEDLLAERGIDLSHETVRFWWNRFGPMFAAEIRKRRVAHMRGYPQWRWHLDEVFVKVNGKLCYLWRAVDHEGEVLEAVVTAKRDKAAALKFLKRIMKKYGRPLSVVTDGLCSYPAAMKEIGNADRQEVGRRLNNRAENSHQPF